MWLIGTGTGALALLLGLLGKGPRRVLIPLGAGLLAMGLLYGALTACLLGGID